MTLTDNKDEPEGLDFVKDVNRDMKYCKRNRRSFGEKGPRSP